MLVVCSAGLAVSALLVMLSVMLRLLRADNCLMSHSVDRVSTVGFLLENGRVVQTLS